MAEFRLSSIAIPGASALAGGVVGALLTVAIVQGKTSNGDVRARPEPKAEIDQAAPAQTNPSSVDERLASLERSLRTLALKDSVARAAAASSAAPQGESPPVADVAPIVDNPVFEAAVRDVMDRAEQERNVEREAQRTEWRKRAAEEWGTQLTEKLRLTDPQKAKVTEIAQAFWDRLRDLRQGQPDAGAPVTREQRREQIAALRKSAEADLAKVLDHSQLTTYNELEEGEKLGSSRSLRGAPRN